MYNFYSASSCKEDRLYINFENKVIAYGDENESLAISDPTFCHTVQIHFCLI